VVIVLGITNIASGVVITGAHYGQWAYLLNLSHRP